MKKRYLMVGAVLAAAFLGFTTLNGNGKANWGPDRPTYSVNSPADHVTFNSITDNPAYGDERAFFDAQDAAAGNSVQPVDQIKVKDGQEIILRAYVHNNGAANLNGANFDGPTVAKNTRVQVTLPKEAGTALRSFATISADNANNSGDPTNTNAKQVQDTADFYADQPFTVEYVPGSAMAISNAVPAGYKVDDSIVTSANGAQIGYTGANGIVPGCLEYTQFVTLKVKVKMSAPAFTLEKTVRKLGTTSWLEETALKAGETAEYRIKVSNTGNTNMTNPVIGDILPPHMTYVAGSSKIYDNARPNGVALNDGITKGALALGTAYGQGTQVFITFQATVNNDFQNDCGVVRIRNIATARNNEVPTEKRDTADVAVDTARACTQNIAKTCESLAIKQTATQIEMTATSNVLNANITGYTFVTTDAANKVINNVKVNTSSNNASHNYALPAVGKYTVKVTVHTDKGDATSDKCTGSFEVKAAAPAYSCDSLKVIGKVDRKVRFQVTAPATNGATIKSVTYDFGDKSEPFTTNAADMLTREYEYKADGEYVARVKVTFTANGKDEVVTNDKCATVVKISTPKPAKAATLPNTGTGEVLGVFLSVTAAGAILYYLTAYRRNNQSF